MARLQVVVVWYVASYRRSYTESDLNTVNYRMRVKPHHSCKPSGYMPPIPIGEQEEIPV